MVGANTLLQRQDKDIGITGGSIYMKAPWIEITILIKTFKRPRICQRLIDSIREFYPDIEIIVATDDDSGVKFTKINKQLNLQFDSGLSAGRNLLVEMCDTPYCLIVDDDCVFTKETDLEKALQEIKDRDLDILQLTADVQYWGRYVIDGDTVCCEKTPKTELVDFCLNIFIAKTDALRRCKWRNELKMGEHFAYFFEHRGKLKIGISDIPIDHRSEKPPDYLKYRSRAARYRQKYLDDNGIKLGIL
jgi:(N-acetylneuraminyl)-galactosylglucosylceramide N-acetylgalactosaminyltransferase